MMGLVACAVPTDMAPTELDRLGLQNKKTDKDHNRGPVNGLSWFWNFEDWAKTGFNRFQLVFRAPNVG